VRAEVQHLVSILGELPGEIPLHLEAGVIGGEGDSHELFTINPFAVRPGRRGV
jgi:hypothetical protein